MRKEIKWVVFDCEGNGLKPTKFYCLSFEDSNGEKGTLRDYEEIRSFFTRYEMYVGHNIRRWDLPHLRRVVNVRPESDIVDTLAVSWYLEPERSNHRLEDYGEDFGVPKPKIDDWNNLTQEEYEHRCEQDCSINIELWRRQIRRLLKIYGSFSDLRRFLRYLDFKMYSAALAEESGWKLDVEAVKKSIEILSKERDEKFEKLRAAMPRVPIINTYKPPKRLYNADGQLSLLGQRWKDRLVEGGFPEGYDGTIDVITGYDDPNPQSPEQVKEWLNSLGWKPQTFKTVKNTKGVAREVPQINLPNGGGICPSIEILFEKEPNLELLDGIGVIKHRLGILHGYLRDVKDGYLHACVAGLTNTLRFKHAEIVNLPKVERAYGQDIRGPLVCLDDEELCGSDMASVEDRIKQHFIFKYDPDYVLELNRPDYDPHLDLAFLAGAITKEDMDGYKADIKPIVTRVKPIRSIYKNGNYACQYGAGVSRLAITCGCDEETARRVHETYWKRNWAIKAVADEQTIKTVDRMMWLKNPISGFWYHLKFKKDVFSTLVQGSAAYVFDRYLAEVLMRRPQVTGQFHDEFILCIKKGHRDECIQMLNECIQEVNDSLRLNRELGISIQFGATYAEIH